MKRWLAEWDESMTHWEIKKSINYQLFVFKKYFTNDKLIGISPYANDVAMTRSIPADIFTKKLRLNDRALGEHVVSDASLQSQRQMQIVSLMATHHPRYFRHASSYATTTNKFGLPLEWDTSNTLFLIRSPAYESRFHIEWLIIWSSSPIESNSFSRLSELSFLLCVCLSLSLDEFTLHFD